MNEEIPIIKIDETFPTCPHCGRYCGNEYEHFDKKYVEITNVRKRFDSYYMIEYAEWLTIITCPNCGGKFQFEDANA